MRVPILLWLILSLAIPQGFAQKITQFDQLPREELTPTTMIRHGITNINDFLFIGQYLYIAAGYSGLLVIDTTASEDPIYDFPLHDYEYTKDNLQSKLREDFRIYPETEFVRLFEIGDILIASGWRSSFFFNVSDPDVPSLIFYQFGQIIRAEKSGELYYLYSYDNVWNGLYSFDGGDFIKLNNIEFDSADHVKFWGQYLIMTSGSTLSLYDIPDPTTPFYYTDYWVGEYIEQIEFANNVLYLKSGNRFIKLNTDDINNIYSELEFFSDNWFDMIGFDGDSFLMFIDIPSNDEYRKYLVSMNPITFETELLMEVDYNYDGLIYENNLYIKKSGINMFDGEGFSNIFNPDYSSYWKMIRASDKFFLVSEKGHFQAYSIQAPYSYIYTIHTDVDFTWGWWGFYNDIFEDMLYIEEGDNLLIYDLAGEEAEFTTEITIDGSIRLVHQGRIFGDNWADGRNRVVEFNLNGINENIMTLKRDQGTRGFAIVNDILTISVANWDESTTSSLVFIDINDDNKRLDQIDFDSEIHGIYSFQNKLILRFPDKITILDVSRDQVQIADQVSIDDLGISNGGFGNIILGSDSFLIQFNGPEGMYYLQTSLDDFGFLELHSVIDIPTDIWFSGIVGSNLIAIMHDYAILYTFPYLTPPVDGNRRQPIEVMTWGIYLIIALVVGNYILRRKVKRN